MQAAKPANDTVTTQSTLPIPLPFTTAEVKPATRDNRSSTMQRIFSHVQDAAASASASSSSARSMGSHRSLPSALSPGSEVGFTDLSTILQSLSLKPAPVIPLSEKVKARCMKLKEAKISPQEFYDYLELKSIKLEDQMRALFNFIKGLPNASELFRQFLEMAGKKADPDVPWRGRVPALRFYIFMLQDGVMATFGKNPFAQAAFRAVCDTINLNCKPNTPPPSPQPPEIHRAKEILFSRLSTLLCSRGLDRQITGCLKHITEVAKARNFVVKGPEHFALSTFLLRVVNPEIATVFSQLETSSDQRLQVIAMNMRTLSICLQGDFNKMKEEEVKKDPNFGPMLRTLLG